MAHSLKPKGVGTASVKGAAALLYYLGASCIVGAQAQVAPPSSPVAANTSTQPYEDLRWKGLAVDLPGPKDTVDGPGNDARAALARWGIGYLGVGLQTFAQNTLDVARTTDGHQLYSGQRPTFFTQDFALLTWDAGRIGLDGGQIAVGGTRSYYTWKQGGPDTFGLLTLSYVQPFLNGRASVRIGYLVNSFEFANPYIGGALASGVFGQSGNLLLQGGLNGGGVTTPGVEVKVALTRALYTRLAIERPISPDGTIAEATQNKSSLDPRVANTGVLAIDEIGYRIDAAPYRHELWVRGAAAVNSSHFIDYATPVPQRNDAANGFGYLLADYQLSQVDPVGRPGRGLYAGGSVIYAPPEQNRFSQLYQARIYAKGLLDARASDQMSLVATYNVFSGALYQAALQAGQLAHGSSLALTGSYGAHLAPGVYLNFGLTYVDHPTIVTYTPSTGSALNALSNLSLFF